MSVDEAIIEEAKAALVHAAQAMLDGRLSFIAGAREVTRLWRTARLPDFHPCILAFTGIDSETDSVPLGELRAMWHPAALARQQPEYDAAEQWAAEFGRPQCVALIEFLKTGATH